MLQGHFAAHIRRMRQMYRDQRDGLAATLAQRAEDHLRIDVPDQGMHLVAYLTNGASDIEIERTAKENGIIVRAMSRFYRSVPPSQALMLGFSGFPRQLIVPAAARLAALVAGANAKPRRFARSRIHSR